MTGRRTKTREPVVWRFTDNRPGHLSQSLGLCQAIQALRAHQCIDVPAAAFAAAAGSWLCKRLPGALRALPRPDLLIGAGRRTHLPLLAARRAAGGRIIVLMRPGLPLSWFDCCILPEHDLRGNEHPRRVIASRGALNSLAAAEDHDPGQGLILVGGPSRHYAWDETGLLAMLEQILRGQPGQPRVRWQISDSRRTPASTSRRLRALAGTGPARFFSHRETRTGWVPRNLGQAGSTWVTEDSMSTLCEALSSGTATGLLPVPSRARRNKLRRCIRQLLEDDMLRDFDAWSRRGALRPPAAGPLQEAGRCAGILRQRGWI